VRRRTAPAIAVSRCPDGPRIRLDSEVDRHVDALVKAAATGRHVAPRRRTPVQLVALLEDAIPQAPDDLRDDLLALLEHQRRVAGRNDGDLPPAVDPEAARALMAANRRFDDWFRGLIEAELARREAVLPAEPPSPVPPGVREAFGLEPEDAPSPDR